MAKDPNSSHTVDYAVQGQDQHLPGELWVSVFKHLGIRTCLAVTCVCKSWRELALGHSQLWTDITIEIGAVTDLLGIGPSDRAPSKCTWLTNRYTEFPDTDEQFAGINASVQKHLDFLPEPFDLTDHLRGPDVGGPGLLNIVERSRSQPISVTLVFHEQIEGARPLPNGVRRILNTHHERIVTLAVFARCVGNIFSLLSSMEQPLRNLTHLYTYSPLETTNSLFNLHQETVNLVIAPTNSDVTLMAVLIAAARPVVRHYGCHPPSAMP